MRDQAERGGWVIQTLALLVDRGLGFLDGLLRTSADYDVVSSARRRNGQAAGDWEPGGDPALSPNILDFKWEPC